MKHNRFLEKPWYDKRSEEHNPHITLNPSSSLEEAVNRSDGNGFLRRSVRFVMPLVAAFYMVSNLACNTQATPTHFPTNTPRPTATATATAEQLYLRQIRSYPNAHLADAIEASEWYKDGLNGQERLFLEFLHRSRSMIRLGTDNTSLEPVIKIIGSDNDRLVQAVKLFPESAVIRHVKTPLSELDLLVAYVPTDKVTWLRNEPDGSVSIQYDETRKTDRQTAENAANLLEYGTRTLEDVVGIPAVRNERTFTLGGKKDETVFAFINILTTLNSGGNPMYITESGNVSEHTIFHELAHNLYKFSTEWYWIEEGSVDYLAWKVDERLLKENPLWFKRRENVNYATGAERKKIIENIIRTSSGGFYFRNGVNILDIPLAQLNDAGFSFTPQMGAGVVFLFDLERLIGEENVLAILSDVTKKGDYTIVKGGATPDLFYQIAKSHIPKNEKFGEVDAFLQRRIYGR